MSDSTSNLAVPVSPDDHIQGDPSALVTLIEYGDFQCPACGMAHPIVKQLQLNYGGDLRLVFRHFPLRQAHPFATLAAETAEGASALGKFWPMHDWLYENQEAWSALGAEGLVAGLRSLDIDASAVERATADPEVAARIRNDFRGGVRSGVNGTPSFFVNGRLHQGDFADGLALAIEDAIANSR
ncbi:MAG TPA: DsbA family protein [Luteimonas sp.]|nr:DsbA family protein [Luteimonas sp.]